MRKSLMAICLAAALLLLAAACNRDNVSNTETTSSAQEAPAMEEPHFPLESQEQSGSDVQSPGERQIGDESRYTRTAVFGLGLHGEDQRALTVGDSIGEWTLADLQIDYDEKDQVHMLEALFEGSVTLKGELSPSALVAEEFDFRVAVEDEGKMPYYSSPDMGQKDAFWFMPDIPEDLAGTLELAPGQSKDCVIIISDYRFIFAYMMAPASATVTAIELL